MKRTSLLAERMSASYNNYLLKTVTKNYPLFINTNLMLIYNLLSMLQR